MIYFLYLFHSILLAFLWYFIIINHIYIFLGFSLFFLTPLLSALAHFFQSIIFGIFVSIVFSTNFFMRVWPNRQSCQLSLSSSHSSPFLSFSLAACVHWSISKVQIGGALHVPQKENCAKIKSKKKRWKLHTHTHTHAMMTMRVKREKRRKYFRNKSSIKNCFKGLQFVWQRCVNFLFSVFQFFSFACCFYAR